MGVNFDQREYEKRRNHSLTLFGTEYTNLPDIPFVLGKELDALFIGKSTLSLDEQTQLVTDIFSYVFGAETYDAWQKDYRFTNELCGDILTYIRYGYRKDVFEAIATGTEKNAGMLARALIMIGATTGEQSLPTSGSSTTSTSIDRATLPGENSRPSSPDSLE